MDKPKISNSRPTLVERLERLTWEATAASTPRDTEDYRLIREALSTLDEVAVDFPDLAAGTSWYGDARGTDLENDYSDLREPMR